ncbi:cytochrome b/b6 domain-containing protein [Parendozoicomonas sp. Alg238-R29]|uniref:cytochrome b/b6 domain-containing protein n=1 Tax=Parendozoicomonas sp. Alg238-R29 TaxID=2993446 RepID=UPI00248DC2CF|nr:cytochrome b/b6 domain-containing protein [Parendozoicomonas sp. Alg238-R29]
MSTHRRIRVWDIPTRLFHWLLVLCFAGLWYTGTEGDMDRHVLLGYTVLGLLLFRIGWGLGGGYFSRFKALQLSPSTALNYLRKGMKTDYPGHNPLGSWGVVVILTGMFVQVGSGLFANDSILTEGPLAQFVSGDTSDWLTTIHSLNFDILLWIIGFHVAAVLFHTMIHKEDILPGMITGRRNIHSRYLEPSPSSWEFFTVLVLFATMVITWLSDLA